jgi:lycopene cyclase domain-containing protein
MAGEYTALAVVAPLAVVALELLVLRTGLLGRARFWIAMGIVLSFQVLVDGWLTRADGTVVHYHDGAASGLRAPWHIPLEDFGFGFALVALTVLLWQWGQRRAQPAAARPGGGDG